MLICFKPVKKDWREDKESKKDNCCKNDQKEKDC